MKTSPSVGVGDISWAWLRNIVAQFLERNAGHRYSAATVARKVSCQFILHHVSAALRELVEEGSVSEVESDYGWNRGQLVTLLAAIQAGDYVARFAAIDYLLEVGRATTHSAAMFEVHEMLKRDWS